MTDSRVHVIGGGGHAKVIISLLFELGYEVAGVFDDDPVKQGESLSGCPVFGPLESLSAAERLPAIIAIGDNAVRKSVSERFDLEWLTVIHPRACVDPTAELAPGTMVLAGAIIQAAARLGRHVIVNTAASVDHDCQVEDFVHVAPGARVAGNGHLETGVLMGVGSVSIPGIHVGAWSTIGAGATLVSDIPAGVVAKGVPARY